MASTWSSGGLNLRLMTTGENDNTWGDQTNDNLKRLENKITGYAAVTLSGTTHTLTFTDNPTSYTDEDGRNFVLNFGGSPGGTCTVTIPARETVYLVLNNTADSNTITLTTGSGTTFNVPAGKDAFVYSDGTNVYNAMADAIFSTITGDGSALTGVLHDVVDDTTPQLGGSLDLNSNNITGTGNINITGSGTFSGDLTVDTDTLYVDSTNNRVGIGTTSPSNKFVVSSSGTQNLEMTGSYIQSFNRSTPAYNTLDFYASTYTFNIGNTVFNEGGLDKDFRVESNNNANMLFVDGGTDRVGIGTSSPATPLHVTSTSYPQYRITNAISFSMGVDSNNDLIFDPTSGSTRDIIFQNSGAGEIRVGIGTGSPSYGLSVESSTDANASGSFKRTSGSEFRILPQGTVCDIGTYSNHTLDFYTNSTRRARLNTAGRFFVNATGDINSERVGILAGTNEQALGLKVSTNAYSLIQGWDSSNNIRFSLTGNGELTHYQGGAIFNQNGANSDFRVESDTNTHALFVDASANRVGILNSAPTQALDVTGTVKATAFQGDGSALTGVGGGDFGGADKYVTYNGSSQSTYKALGLSSMTRISALYYRLNFNSTLSGNTYLTTFAHSNSTSANTRGAAIGFIDSRTTTTVQVRAEERVGGFTGELDYISVGVWDV